MVASKINRSTLTILTGLRQKHYNFNFRYVSQLLEIHVIFPTGRVRWYLVLGAVFVLYELVVCKGY